MSDLTYTAAHLFDDTQHNGIPSLDAAIEWGLAAVRNCPGPDDEDNSVCIYIDGDLDRIAVVYSWSVVVNDGHGTNTWPAGWTYLEDTNA